MENSTQSILDSENLYPLSSPRGSYSTLENPSIKQSMSKSTTSGFPTTFIQADVETFKKVVQMLTGPSDDTKQASKPAGPARTGPKKPGFKLQERRNSLKNLKVIPRLVLDSALSPSVLGLHRLVLSPAKSAKPKSCDGSLKTGNRILSFEEKMIAEKGFYLHASPLGTPRGSEPQLLPLFPTTSPRVSSTS